MLSGLFKNRQSINVGGPIGSMKDAKSQRLANLDYEAAYLAKRLTEEPNSVAPGLDVNIDRYKPEKDLGHGQLVKFDQAEKTAFLLNAVKGYKAEAEESLKMEFKDWLAGRHYDNADPSPYDNNAGGLERRDPSGLRLDDWHPTWWGTKQLTHLPGVREYLREDHISADKHSFDMNMLAHFGPSNLEEAWAYFKYWVKRRPVGPYKKLNDPADKGDDKYVFERSGPVSMAPPKVEQDGSMPELLRRETPKNPSLLDEALIKAKDDHEAMLKSKKYLDAVKAKQRKALRGETVARAKAIRAKQIQDELEDPFYTDYATDVYARADATEMGWMQQITNDFKTRVGSTSKDGPEALWREAMKENHNKLTRKRYEYFANFTSTQTEPAILAQLQAIDQEADLYDADRMKLISDLDMRSKNTGSFAEHYLRDQMLLAKSGADLKTYVANYRNDAAAASQAATVAEAQRLQNEAQAARLQKEAEEKAKQAAFDAAVQRAVDARIAALPALAPEPEPEPEQPETAQPTMSPRLPELFDRLSLRTSPGTSPSRRSVATLGLPNPLAQMQEPLRLTRSNNPNPDATGL